MSNFYDDRKKLERDFFSNCHLEEWKRITGDLGLHYVPDEIKKLHNRFIELLQLPDPYIVDKEVHIKQMKEVLETVRQCYKDIETKYKS